MKYQWVRKEYEVKKSVKMSQREMFFSPSCAQIRRFSRLESVLETTKNRLRAAALCWPMWDDRS
jgi:hypothetical protein